MVQLIRVLLKLRFTLQHNVVLIHLRIHQIGMRRRLRHRLLLRTHWTGCRDGSAYSGPSEIAVHSPAQRGTDSPAYTSDRNEEEAPAPVAPADALDWM